MSFTGLPPGDYSLGDRDRTPGRDRVIEQLNGKVEETLRQGLAIFFCPWLFQNSFGNFGPNFLTNNNSKSEFDVENY